MKRYFCAESAHGSETSHGFANDTIVLAFAGKQARDEYVKNKSRTNISCHAIPRRGVTKYACNYNMSQNSYYEPQPFSGQFWGIDGYVYDEIPGCLGQVLVCDDRDESRVDRLNK